MNKMYFVSLTNKKHIQWSRVITVVTRSTDRNKTVVISLSVFRKSDFYKIIEKIVIYIYYIIRIIFKNTKIIK